MKKSLLLAIATVIILIIGTALVSEAFRSPDPECKLSGWHQTYLSWDDDAGPCTYAQRVTFLVFIYLGYPFLFMWPFTLLIIFYVVFTLLKNHRLVPEDYTLIGKTVFALLSLSYIAMLFFRLFGQ